MTTESLPVLAILGGTGDLGTGLARRWAQAGYQVVIGSRTQEKAEAAGLDEADVHGLLDWIESQWMGDDRPGWSRDPLPDAPSDKAFRFFGDVDADYISPRGLGFLVELFNDDGVDALVN